MKFEEALVTIAPKLRQLAFAYRTWSPAADEDDLFSEMTAHLRERWSGDGLGAKTESYIVQSCYFHLRNYLRTIVEKGKSLSLEALREARDDSGEDEHRECVLCDPAPAPQRYLEERALYDTIMKNGLSRMEKDIILCLYEGMTVREIGEKFGISHVMVVKYKKSIARKVTMRYAALLV
jgi:Bacterial regulatory proteins, luxR family.